MIQSKHLDPENRTDHPTSLRDDLQEFMREIHQDQLKWIPQSMRLPQEWLVKKKSVCQLGLHRGPSWPIMATSTTSSSQMTHSIWKRAVLTGFPLVTWSRNIIARAPSAAHSSVQFTDNEERLAKGSRRTLSMCPGLRMGMEMGQGKGNLMGRS